MSKEIVKYLCEVCKEEFAVKEACDQLTEDHERLEKERDGLLSQYKTALEDLKGWQRQSKRLEDEARNYKEAYELDHVTRKELADLKAENKRLKELVSELVDEEKCFYDHHGYCQTHCLQEKPCPHEQAQEMGLCQ